jgi:hypothetical protein
MSSLSYQNAAGRVGFDFNTEYNDFTNEGHMYPVHGVGDLDKTAELMANFVKSLQGEAFPITDLGITIRVSSSVNLTIPNAFFDFHSIPTKHLDGSTKLPDNSRIEDHITYFNPHAESDWGPDGLADIDWITGSAMLRTDLYGLGVDRIYPTTLTSTRMTPYLEQDENLGLTFFMDSSAARVNNGGHVSNWRMVVPNYELDIVWFVAKAYVPCESLSESPHCELMETTTGDQKYGRPRTAEETNDLKSISYGQNRLMKTVSTHTVRTSSINDKMASFNQRYGNKMVDFGDMMLRTIANLDVVDTSNADTGLQATMEAMKSTYLKWASQKEDKQIAFYEMCSTITDYLDGELASSSTDKKSDGIVGPNQELADGSAGHALFAHFKSNYLKSETFNIGLTALNTKCRLGKIYMPTSIGETGWMVVERPDELAVPNEDGEFFIGWSVLNQPPTYLHVARPEMRDWAMSHGYKIHQGPGLLFMTGGEYAHPGNREPYILQHNYDPDQCTLASCVHRDEQQPSVHWRLDKPDVIQRSLEHGAVTEANVGAGQRMLASIGTRTKLTAYSRSPNFLGQNYQKLLAHKSDLRVLYACSQSPPTDECDTEIFAKYYGYSATYDVYEIVEVDDAPSSFVYNAEQLASHSYSQ